MIRRIALPLPFLALVTCLTLLPACGKKAPVAGSGGGGNGDPAAPGTTPGQGGGVKSNPVLFAHVSGKDLTSSLIFTEIVKGFQTEEGKKFWAKAINEKEQDNGVNVLNIESATAYVMEVPERADPKFVLIVSMAKPYDKDLLLKRNVGKTPTADSRGFYKASGPDSLLTLIDDKTFALLHTDLADKFAAGYAKDRSGWPVSAELTKAATGHTLYVNGDLTQIPTTLRNSPDMKQMEELTAAKSVLLTVDLKGKQINLNANLGFADTAAAGKAKEKAQPFLGMAGLLVGGMTNGKGAEDLGALLPAVKELQNTVSGMKMDVSGSDLTLAATYKADFDIPAMIAQALAEIKKTEEKMRGSNEFKQAMIGLHNHFDEKIFLPILGIGMNAALLNKPTDKALLSWRVAILPYIEQEALYKQFKLDEPWDSEHNKKLIEKMPSVFAPPAGKTANPGYTHMQMIVGPNAMQTSNNKGILGISDGTSNTIALVEAAEAVVWTKPDDVMLKGKETGAEVKKKLGGLRPGGCLVAMWDGSVRFVSEKITDKTLLGAITPTGGERLGSDW